jgi:hypothetical protein
MHDLERTPRPLRWYEWLAVLLLAGYAAGARAEVYQCTDARGDVTFQSRPCADAAHQSVVAIAPAPKYAPSPEYAVAPGRSTRSVERVRTSSRRGEARAAGSYECRTSDGQVFYRHSTCPRSVPAADRGATHRGGRGAAGGAAAKSVAVTATRISREDACYELRRAAAAGRSGRIHDQDVSSYDKNLGRDPCR